MGAFYSKQKVDGTYEPSSFSSWVAVPSKSGYVEPTFKTVNTGKAKILVVCTDDGRLAMANGATFASGNHPVETALPLMDLSAAGFGIEIATISGGPVVLEEWAIPQSDTKIPAFLEKVKASLMKPLKLDDVSPTLAPYAALFLPGGHGAMINLPESAALGALLRKAHDRGMPTITICHGPAALLAAGLGGQPFPYAGYKAVCFTRLTDTITPYIGYIPGHMPWHMAPRLAQQGMVVTNYMETGAVCVDRELITADSPYAANQLGKVAVPLVVEFARKAEGLI